MFWMRINKLKYLALLGIMVFIGLFVSLILRKLLSSVKKLTHFHLFSLILLGCFAASLGLAFRSNIPLPVLPVVSYDTALKISNEDGRSIPSSEAMVGVKIISVDSSHYSEIICDKPLFEIQKKYFFSK